MKLEHEVRGCPVWNCEMLPMGSCRYVAWILRRSKPSLKNHQIGKVVRLHQTISNLARAQPIYSKVLTEFYTDSQIVDIWIDQRRFIAKWYQESTSTFTQISTFVSS